MSVAISNARMLKVDSHIGAAYRTICSSLDVSIECNARVPTLDVTRRDIWLNKPRGIAHRRYFHSAHKVHTRCIQKRLVAKLIYSGRSERADVTFFPQGAQSVFVFSLLCPHVFTRSLYLFGLWTLDDAIRWNRYDSDNLFAKHCNPSLIVSCARCLSRAQTLDRPSGGEKEREREWKRYIRVVHWRHAVSVMYRAEKAQYS